MFILIIQPEEHLFCWEKNGLTLYWAIKNTIEKYDDYTKLQIIKIIL